MTVTAAGIYELDEQDYHADRMLAPSLGRSLSQSGAKTLLQSPARFAYERDRGRPPKDAFDLGSVIHALVLRGGDTRIRVADVTEWRTNAAKEFKAKARAERLIPVHRKELRAASKVASSVRRDPLAKAILAEGKPEVSLYAIDPDTGVTLRARLDWVRHTGSALDCLVDLKSADYGRGTPDAFGRSAASYHYPMQAWWYRYVYWLVTGEWLPFLTITVETEAPYFVTVGQYAEEDLAAGEAYARRAIAEYAERESSGNWADPPTIHTFELPAWYARSA